MMIKDEDKKLFEIAIAYIMYVISKDLIEMLNALPDKNEKDENNND